MKTLSMLDPQGNAIEVPQEQVVPLLRSGFKAKRGQSVTLSDGTPLSVENLASGLSEGMADPALETSQGRFKREAEAEYGGLSGLAKGVGYGALQGATFGLGGKGLMAAGLASPEDLAKLQEAQGGAIFGGELVGGLAPAMLTGGGSLAGEAAGLAATKTLGRRVAESAGREALIGAGYGAGSEVTQAGIEGRETNLGQAAGMGAAIGGTLGAAFPVAGAAVERLGAKKAAALAAKEAEAAKPADIGFAAKEAEVRETAARKSEMAQSILDEQQAIRDELHRMVPGAATGENLGGGIDKAIKRTNSLIDNSIKTITKTADSLSLIEDTADLARNLESAQVDAAGLRTQLASYKTELTKMYNSSLEDLQLARNARKDQSAIDSLQNRVDAVQSSITAIDGTLDKVQKIAGQQHEIANLGRQYTVNRGAQNLAEKDIQKTLRKLDSLGERTLEAAGPEGASARAAADELTQRLEQVTTEAPVSKIPTSTAGKAEPFARRLIEVAGDTNAVKAVIQDLAAADIAHGKAGSLFGEALGREGVRDALFANPEATAYVQKFAQIGIDSDALKRAGGKRLGSKIAGFEGTAAKLASDVRSGVEAEAALDAENFYKAASSNHAAGLEAQAKYNGMYPAAEKAAETVSHAAPPVAAKTIVAADPEQTAALRATLGQQEATLAELQKSGKEIAQKHIDAKNTLADVEKQLAGEKRDNVRRALVQKRDALQGQLDNYKVMADRVGSAERSLADDAAGLRTNRAVSAEAAATSAENIAIAKAAKADADRALKSSILDRAQLRETQALGQRRELVNDLEALRQRNNQLNDIIESFESSGGSSALGKSKLGAGAFRLDPQGTFQRDWKAFLSTAEGKAMQKAAAEQSKAAGKLFENPDKVMGFLAAAELAHGVMTGGFMSMLAGAVMAAKTGKTGMAKAASALNPVAFYNAAGKVMSLMERGALPTGRAMSVNKGYTFSVPAANAFVENVLSERADADRAFDQMLKTGVNPQQIDAARQRFGAALDYLERKRPATSNGADAQAFARSVALIRNPDLLAKFVHDGSLRQQDVDVLQAVSPEAYDQLKSAVALLQEKKPEMAMNLAPLFKLMTKSKMSLKGPGISLAFAQSLIGSAPSSQGPMVPGSETAAARARPGKESSLVESTKL